MTEANLEKYNLQKISESDRFKFPLHGGVCFLPVPYRRALGAEGLALGVYLVQTAV